MRLSVKEGDVGYNPYVPSCNIFLDGKSMFPVLTADEEIGYVIVYGTDANGFLMNENGEWVTRMYTGKVKIEMEEDE